MSETIKVNGIELSVKEAGSGRDLILIHGRGYSKENMDRLFDSYKDRFHVISYDVRGHGESSKPDAFTLEDNAEDLAALTNALARTKPVVIGFSMGSYIALRTAEKYPDLFSGLVLIGTKGAGAFSSTQKVVEEGEAQGLTREQIAEQMIRRVFAPQVSKEEIAAFDREIAGPHILTEKEQEAITNSLRDFDLLAEAEKVTIPVLVMTGEYDGLNGPEKGREVAQALPNARFEVIPNAGHIAWFENEERVISLISAFAAETGKLQALPPMERVQGEALQKLRERIHWFETHDAERYEGSDEPLEASALYSRLLEDYDRLKPRIHEKRLKLQGFVSHLGPDEFHAPSFELTDANGSRCFALVVFPRKDIYERLHEGARVTVIGNVLFIREPYGLVMKKCELLEVSATESR